MANNNEADAATLDMAVPAKVGGDARDPVYWEQRNALVDAVLAADKAYPTAQKSYTEQDPEQRARYSAALQALRDFDAAHGGAPVL